MAVVAFLAIIVQTFLPWWSIAPIAFITGGALGKSGLQAFMASFLGIALLWFGYALYIDQQSASILSVRVAELLYLPNALLLVIISGVVGGLVAGFSALAGWHLKAIFQRPASKYY